MIGRKHSGTMPPREDTMSANSNIIQIGVRLDKALLKRIDEHTDEMAKLMPSFSRTQMIHLLLIKGIEVHEQESRQEQPAEKR